MKIAQLAPKWIQPSQWADPGIPFFIGMSFNCPCEKCSVAACSTCGHRPQSRRLVVMFHPAVDPAHLQDKYGPGWWPRPAGAHTRVSGETFETLTITPSIGYESIGHWHGHITNGETNP